MNQLIWLSFSPYQVSFENFNTTSSTSIITTDRQATVMTASSRRWLVCASAFIIQFVVIGLMNCGGVMYAALVEEFNSSRGATGETEVLSILPWNSVIWTPFLWPGRLAL